MRSSDWSSDVCSSDLHPPPSDARAGISRRYRGNGRAAGVGGRPLHDRADPARGWRRLDCLRACRRQSRAVRDSCHEYLGRGMSGSVPADVQAVAKSWESACRSLDVDRILSHLSEDATVRSEEHTSELQSLMRISYAVFCLKKKHNCTPLPH